MWADSSSVVLYNWYVLWQLVVVVALSPPLAPLPVVDPASSMVPCVSCHPRRTHRRSCSRRCPSRHQTLHPDYHLSSNARSSGRCNPSSLPRIPSIHLRPENKNHTSVLYCLARAFTSKSSKRAKRNVTNASSRDHDQRWNRGNQSCHVCHSVRCMHHFIRASSSCHERDEKHERQRGMHAERHVEGTRRREETPPSWDLACRNSCRGADCPAIT